MKPSLLIRLTLCAKTRRCLCHNGMIGLRPSGYAKEAQSIGAQDCVTFEIIQMQTGCVAGEIALRIGESDALFYLGHIGYHVNPPFRGRHYAEQACRLCMPLLLEMGMRTVVVTTDEDNLPSVRTCERLGCRYECTVDVPPEIVEEFEISRRKRRYVLFLA